MHVISCGECGVPESFSQVLAWLNNGDIVQKANSQARLCFIECDNLDPLLENIGEIIGISIEHLVVNVLARATATYMNQMVPQEIKDKVADKQIDPTVLAAPVMTYCHLVGYGKYEFLDSRYERDENDYARIRVTKPFCVPMAAGAFAGALSAFVGGEHKVTYKETSPEVYEFQTSWTEYPEEIEEKIPLLPYSHSDGNIDLARCATCGSPKAFSGYKWDLDEGLIKDQLTGRRMAVVGPEALDHLYKALEEELGDTIPEAVVEAQRRFTETGTHSIDEIKDENSFRTQLALMGLGNMQHMRMSPGGLHMRIDNAAGCLLTVGTVQGLFEMAFNTRSTVKWDLSPAGDLQVEVIPIPD